MKVAMTVFPRTMYLGYEGFQAFVRMHQVVSDTLTQDFDSPMHFAVYFSQQFERMKLPKNWDVVYNKSGIQVFRTVDMVTDEQENAPIIEITFP